MAPGPELPDLSLDRGQIYLMCGAQRAIVANDQGLFGSQSISIWIRIPHDILQGSLFTWRVQAPR